jgi:hypothetical protein
MSIKRIKIEYSVDVDVDRWVAYSGLSPEDIDSNVHDFAMVSLYLKFHEIGVLAKPNERSEYACDRCGVEVPDGEGHYVPSDLPDDDDRVCAECAECTI